LHCAASPDRGGGSLIEGRPLVCRGLICADLLTRSTLLLDYGRRRLAFLPSERELLSGSEQ
jgi:hypothetical protein